MSMSFIWLKISDYLKNNFLMLKELSLSSVKSFKVEGSTPLLLTGVHWLAKYLLNMLALASNSEVTGTES